ncbi:kinase [Bacillus sp. FJAT-27225]|uniref:kinase-associated lipoprotein B n=1 Tax=Bacillus sp. FJAT-27225 TaxID=1743144 RepID=UPI00080C275F|nr:kinase-associated lipoprotein B [Bacillus sp. FJAT-27225]OCA87587.1 kinase [Bacillus sp. FJAT-27225]
MSEFKKGDIVTAIYKTGKYIGEFVEERPAGFLVRVLAVTKHPMQGDLHHPKDAEVGFFHERRALSFREGAVIPKQMVKKHEGDVPEYKESLKLALEKLKDELEGEESAFAQMSLRNIESLEKDYFK